MQRAYALLTVVILGVAPVVGAVITTGVGLPEDPTGYDYARAEENTTDPWDTPTPTRTPAADTAVSFGGQTIEQTFRFDQGSAYPSGWSWPIRVEFQRPDAGNWTSTLVVNVDRMVPVTVELLAEEHYRIVVEDADGDRRALGLYVPAERGAERTVVIGGCCVDDFSTETP